MLGEADTPMPQHACSSVSPLLSLSSPLGGLFGISSLLPAHYVSLIFSPIFISSDISDGRDGKWRGILLISSARAPLHPTPRLR